MYDEEVGRHELDAGPRDALCVRRGAWWSCAHDADHAIAFGEQKLGRRVRAVLAGDWPLIQRGGHGCGACFREFVEHQKKRGSRKLPSCWAAVRLGGGNVSPPPPLRAALSFHRTGVHAAACRPSPSSILAVDEPLRHDLQVRLSRLRTRLVVRVGTRCWPNTTPLSQEKSESCDSHGVNPRTKLDCAAISAPSLRWPVLRMARVTPRPAGRTFGQSSWNRLVRPSPLVHVRMRWAGDRAACPNVPW